MREKQRQERVQEIIRRAVDFHGHLGPFLVIGVRMGLIALDSFNLEKFSTMKIVTETGTKPSLSCIIDGIQVSTGCTLGRGSIEVRDNKRPKAVFLNEDKSLEIELRKEILEKIFESFRTKSSEKMAEKLMNLEDDELFIIKFRALDQKTIKR